MSQDPLAAAHSSSLHSAGELPWTAAHLSPFAVLLAAALVLVNAAISVRFSLGLHRTLFVASIRCGPAPLGFLLPHSAMNVCKEHFCRLHPCKSL